MYSLKIQEPGSFHTKHELFFDSMKEIETYLTNCFPYQKERIQNILIGSLLGISFCITNNEEETICGIDIEKIELYKATKMKAWNGITPICEIFNTENCFKIEEKFFDWLSKIEEDCIDSYRICKKNDKKAMKDYNSLKTCCGSLDEEIEINGEIYMFGCNFGH